MVRPRHALAILAVFVLSLVNTGARAASSDSDEPEAVKRVTVIEWIPLGANTSVMRAFEASLRASRESEAATAQVERINVFGDDKELARALEKLAENPPDLIIGFGAHVSESALQAAPDVPLLTLLVRDPEILSAKAEKQHTTFSAISADPDPDAVLHLARELIPNVKRLGIMYTDKYGPNMALADKLEGVITKNGGWLVRIMIGAGFCRTDSDFMTALAKTSEAGEVDILYVPDDPNCSRFGTQIYRYADEHGWPAIGSEATIGKGCVAALVLDYEAIGKRTATLCAHMLKGPSQTTEQHVVPRRVVLDKTALDKHGLPLSSWLSENSERLR